MSGEKRISDKKGNPLERSVIKSVIRRPTETYGESNILETGYILGFVPVDLQGH